MARDDGWLPGNKPPGRDIGGGAVVTTQPRTGNTGRYPTGARSINYPLPTYPVLDKVQNPPAFYLNPDQYTPIDYAVPTGPVDATEYTGRDSANRGNWNLRTYYDQLLGTSKNVRNRSLMDILNRSNMPLEQIYAGQGADRAVEQRATGIGQIEANAAGRGIYNSGALDRALRTNELDYIQNLANAASSGRDMEIKRQGDLAGQLMSLVEGDINFYRYLNAGRDVATGRAGGVNIGALSNLGAAGSTLLASAFLERGNNPNVITGDGTLGAGLFNYNGGNSYPVSGSDQGYPISTDAGFGF